jgi:hypothetical protein
MEFKEFKKIPRLSRECVITEKIDGTNGVVCISEDNGFFVGSKSRWLDEHNDNFGFWKWAQQHKEDLMKLGVGYHFGEWWGCGIQRHYDLSERRFSLFNVSKWSDETLRPKCCSVVPVLYTGMFETPVVDAVLEKLKQYGSSAAPGFMNPEGVVVFHKAGNLLFKKTIEKDNEPKGK